MTACDRCSLDEKQLLWQKTRRMPQNTCTVRSLQNTTIHNDTHYHKIHNTQWYRIPQNTPPLWKVFKCCTCSPNTLVSNSNTECEHRFVVFLFQHTLTNTRDSVSCYCAAPKCGVACWMLMNTLAVDRGSFSFPLYLFDFVFCLFVFSFSAGRPSLTSHPANAQLVTFLSDGNWWVVLYLYLSLYFSHQFPLQYLCKSMPTPSNSANVHFPLMATDDLCLPLIKQTSTSNATFIHWQTSSEASFLFLIDHWGGDGGGGLDSDRSCDEEWFLNTNSQLPQIVN